MLDVPACTCTQHCCRVADVLRLSAAWEWGAWLSQAVCMLAWGESLLGTARHAVNMTARMTGGVKGQGLWLYHRMNTLMMWEFYRLVCSGWRQWRWLSVALSPPSLLTHAEQGAGPPGVPWRRLLLLLSLPRPRQPHRLLCHPAGTGGCRGHGESDAFLKFKSFEFACIQ